VFGPDFVGFVTDARFRLDTSSTGRPARLYGIVVSPHARSSSLGYERSDVRSPWPIAALVRWRHRGSFLVRWEDIERVDVRQSISDRHSLESHRSCRDPPKRRSAACRSTM
jgi:hypothetical protein